MEKKDYLASFYFERKNGEGQAKAAYDSKSNA